MAGSLACDWCENAAEWVVRHDMSEAAVVTAIGIVQFLFFLPGSDQFWQHSP
jgi:hypothetical protein